MSNSQSGAAVVLRVVPYGDADAVVTLLTRDYGRVSAFARRARSSKKPRFGAALEPFTLVDAEWRARSSSADLVNLSRADVLDAYPRLRNDFDRIAFASYAVEIAREGTRDGEDTGTVFRLLTGYLGALAERGASLEDRTAFELALLAALGFTPELRHCVACEEPPERQHVYQLSAASGGLVCDICSRSAIEQGLSPGTVRSLLDVAGTIPPAPSPVRFTQQVRRDLADLIPAYMERVLGKKLKSRAFLETLL